MLRTFYVVKSVEQFLSRELIVFNSVTLLLDKSYILAEGILNPNPLIVVLIIYINLSKWNGVTSKWWLI